VARVERGNRLVDAASLLAGKRLERPWQLWVRVHLGGERRIDIARACGYKDGSAITHTNAHNCSSGCKTMPDRSLPCPGEYPASKPNSTTFRQVSSVDPV
jgi:hypothetical protein